MFNESAIIRVLNLERTDVYSMHGYDAFFSICPVIEFRTTYGYWMVLQTEKNYIVIGYDGVNVVEKLPERDDGFDYDETDWVCDEENMYSYETVLFRGEHLQTVIEEEECKVLKFNHFDMYLYPLEPGYIYYRPNSSYVPVHGYERYLDRRCECGGKGELMMDHVGDFFLRCERCHKATDSGYIIERVFDEWNSGDLTYHEKTLGEERFWDYCREPVNYIAISKDINWWDDNVYSCCSVMLSIGDALFGITSHRVGADEFDFDIRRMGGFNDEFWPYRVTPEESESFSFIRKETEEGCSPVLRFQLGVKPILITADEQDLMIGLSHIGANDEWIDFDDSVLVKR